MDIVRAVVLWHQLQLLTQQLECALDALWLLLFLVLEEAQFEQVVEGDEMLVPIAMEEGTFQSEEVLWLDPVVGGGHEADEPQWDMVGHLPLNTLFDIVSHLRLFHSFKDPSFKPNQPLELLSFLHVDDVLNDLNVGGERVVLFGQFGESLHKVLQLRDGGQALPFGVRRPQALRDGSERLGNGGEMEGAYHAEYWVFGVDNNFGVLVFASDLF